MRRLADAGCSVLGSEEDRAPAKVAGRTETDGLSTPFRLPLRVDSGRSGIDGIAVWCILGV
jgi:hypothetical protein